MSGQTEERELISPLESPVVSDVFGQRVNPVTGREEMHKGIDLAAAEGTPVAACADGTVTDCGESPSYGRFIRVEGEKYSYLYAHLSRIDKKSGETVKQGDVLGASGSTGQATGPHLHFELYKGDELTDPHFVIEKH